MEHANIVFNLKNIGVTELTNFAVKSSFSEKTKMVQTNDTYGNGEYNEYFIPLDTINEPLFFTMYTNNSLSQKTLGTVVVF